MLSNAHKPAAALARRQAGLVTRGPCCAAWERTAAAHRGAINVARMAAATIGSARACSRHVQASARSAALVSIASCPSLKQDPHQLVQSSLYSTL